MVADLALILWIPISVVLFLRLRPLSAAALTLLGGILLLPSERVHDFPLLPALDKYRISVLAATVGYLVLNGSNVRWPRVGPSITACILLLLGGGVMTAVTNGDPLSYGPKFIPAMRLYDAVSLAGGASLDLILPFLLGWMLHRRPGDLKLSLALSLLCLCAYSLPMFYEMRMAPVLHRQIYGYFQFNMSGERRLGGFRPVVFMPSGLALGLFIAGCTVAGTAFWRAQRTMWTFLIPTRSGQISLRMATGAVLSYGFVLLLLSRSSAAIIYGVVGTLVLSTVRSRMAVRIAMVLAVIVLAYPTLRSADLFPTQEIVDFATRLSPERAESLDFRFGHENALLAHALERPLWGWGGWNRNRIFDATTGRNLSTTDGYWVIQYGVRGLAGFAGTFGLLLIPIFSAARRIHRIPQESDRMLVAGAVWIAAINAVDLLPNAMMTPFAVYIVGALAGVVAHVPAYAAATVPVAPTEPSATQAEEAVAAGVTSRAERGTSKGSLRPGWDS